MPSTTAAAERLPAIARAYRHRAGAPTTGEKAYWVYAAALVGAVTGLPMISTLASSLAQPAAVAAMASPVAGQVASGVCGGLLAGAAAFGAVRGPALLPPFFVAAVAGNDLPRARTLRRPFWTAATALTMLITTGFGLLAAVLASTGTTTPGRAAAGAAAAACFGVLTGTAWLVGQRIGPNRGWMLPAALLAATALTVAVPRLAVLTPWGWVGLTWPSATPWVPWAPAALALAATCAAALVPRLLNTLRGPLLLDQALRWKNAGTAAIAGDFAGALAPFRALPHLGRSWPAVVGAPVWARFCWRDLIGAARTPVRAVTGLAFLCLGAFLAALAPALVPTWLPASIGAVLGYLAIGVFTDGFRHAADVAAAPAIYGYSTAGLYARHAVLPLSMAALATVLGAGAATLAGAPVHALSTGASFAMLAVLAVAVRAFDSAKGLLPLILLTPIPTPAGDLSSLMVLAWQADALLIVVVAAAIAVATIATAAPLAAAITTITAILIVLALTAHRVRRR